MKIPNAIEEHSPPPKVSFSVDNPPPLAGGDSADQDNYEDKDLNDFIKILNFLSKSIMNHWFFSKYPYGHNF